MSLAALLMVFSQMLTFEIVVHLRRLKEVVHPNQNLAWFVLYFIINTFLKT